MAIQKINLGTEPLGEGGDTYRSANTKINENFSNTAHAASRLVGANPTDLVENRWARRAAFTTIDSYLSTPDSSNFDTLKAGTLYLAASAGNGGPKGLGNFVSVLTMDNYDSNTALQMSYGYAVPGMSLRVKYSGSWSSWISFYHTGNTTRDTATGFLKTSSPVLHVYNDKITKIHEAEQLDIKVNKKGVGHYEIHGTTGLRKNDGWFMAPPRDVHGNVLCMVDLEEKGGVVILKTYKKKFDFETVSIVHDYENPMDIPEGVCVEFRFNDLPQEDSGEFPTSEDK